ncbi:MAG: hypothetical protein ABR587_17315 [Candidatus Binatia bacterium]
MTRAVSSTLMAVGAIGAAAQTFAYFVYFEPALLAILFFVAVFVVGAPLPQRAAWVRRFLRPPLFALSTLAAAMSVAATVMGLDWQPRFISASIAAFFISVALLLAGVTNQCLQRATPVFALIFLLISLGWWFSLARDDAALRGSQRVTSWR